jgi:ribosomal protein S15P/S13E
LSEPRRESLHKPYDAWRRLSQHVAVALLANKINHLQRHLLCSWGTTRTG